MKEEGAGSRKWDRSLSSTRAAESVHRQKRHPGDPNGDPEQSGKDNSAASGKGKAKKSTPSSSGPQINGGGSGFPSRNPDSSAVPIDSHFSGDSTVPESAIAVETADGRIAYEDTPKEPILKYEDCLVLNKAGKQTTKFWTVDLLRVEHEGLRILISPLPLLRLL